MNNFYNSDYPQSLATTSTQSAHQRENNIQAMAFPEEMKAVQQDSREYRTKQVNQIYENSSQMSKMTIQTAKKSNITIEAKKINKSFTAPREKEGD